MINVVNLSKQQDLRMSNYNPKHTYKYSYYPKHSSIESHLDSLSKGIDSLSSKYDNFVLLGVFNSCMEIL